MDPKTESKVDFDDAMIKVNEILRAVRATCLATGTPQPLVPLAHRVAAMLNREGRPSWSMRQYARMIEEVAKAIEACERSHPGIPCHEGSLMVHQVILPVMLSISCASAGFELARGKDMKLEDAE